MEVQTSSGMMEKVGKQEVGISLYVGILLAVCVGVHIPQMEMPSMPDFGFTVPELPDIELPDLPELPDMKMPNIPEIKLPKMPEDLLPEIDLTALPEMPELPELPEMPDINLNPSDLAQKGYNKAMEGVYDMKDGLTETLHRLEEVIIEPLEKVWTKEENPDLDEEISEVSEKNDKDEIIENTNDNSINVEGDIESVKGAIDEIDNFEIIMDDSETTEDVTEDIGINEVKHDESTEESNNIESETHNPGNSEETMEMIENVGETVTLSTEEEISENNNMKEESENDQEINVESTIVEEITETLVQQTGNTEEMDPSSTEEGIIENDNVNEESIINEDHNIESTIAEDIPKVISEEDVETQPEDTNEETIDIIETLDKSQIKDTDKNSMELGPGIDMQAGG